MADSEAPRMMLVGPALAPPVALSRWLPRVPALARTLLDRLVVSLENRP